MNAKKEMKIGIPKGSLQENTLRLLEKAGYKARLSRRSYHVDFDVPGLSGMLLRPQEMPEYIERGSIDAGITGRDWVVECGVDVVEVCEFRYSKRSMEGVRWVVAVPEDSPIEDVSQLAGGVVATELVRTTERFFRERGVDVKVRFSHGATEVKVPYLADAIVELTETGSSLRANRLKIIDTVMESVTVLVANRESLADPWKKEQLESLALLFQSAVDAESKVGLKLNVAKESLDEVLSLLPALHTPTVSPLSDTGWYAVESIVDEAVVRTLVPRLKRAGASGIIEYPLNKVVP